MAEAPGLIAALAAERARVAGCLPVVGITGPVGSGKSTLAARLGSCIIRTDDYLPDYHLTPDHLRDLPESADLPLLLRHLLELREGGAAEVPVWSFQSHRREGMRAVRASGMVVVEGIHALHAAVRSAIHVSVFVEAPAAVRWARWERLEVSGERGWGVEKARAFFHGVAEPTFATHGLPLRATADVLVGNP